MIPHGNGICQVTVRSLKYNCRAALLRPVLVSNLWLQIMEVLVTSSSHF